MRKNVRMVRYKVPFFIFSPWYNQICFQTIQAKMENHRNKITLTFLEYQRMKRTVCISALMIACVSLHRGS